MKLYLFFIALDLLTLLAYPILFVHGKLRQFSEARESITLANSLVPILITPGKWPIRKV